MSSTNTRTRNVTRNAIISLACQLTGLVIGFISRTVFIQVLGSEYLGLNGLFTNILTILSFAELGIGNAITFSLYKPLAENDRDKIKSLLDLFKKVYYVIAGIILIGGMAVAPFLPYLMAQMPNIPENIYLLYTLFVFNAFSSYFFAHKRTLIIADQKTYAVSLVNEGIHVIQSIVQITLLFIVKSFILFLIIQIIATWINNIACLIMANKMYPYIKEPSEKLAVEERKGIFANVRALAYYQFGGIIINGTDNILVSMLMGVTPVGIISNYTILTEACNSLASKITTAFTASVGNLNTQNNLEIQYDVFKKILFICVWLYGFASVALINVLNPFIDAWLGNDYLLDMLTVSGIVAGLYVKGVAYAAYTYRTTLGYFRQGRWAPVAGAFLNIALSLAMYYTIGLAGIFIATPISIFLTTGIMDAYLVYKNCFGKPLWGYFAQYAGYMFLIISLALICHQVVGLISLTGWIGVIVNIIIVSLLYNILMFVIFFKTKMFKELLQSFKSTIKR